MTEKVLLVDDDSNVLKGFERHLRKRFDIVLAIGGFEAIETIKTQGPFAVVVSDMQMPEMSGVELLAKIRQSSAHTVRMMLTGNADQRTAVDALNEGNIFRFLNKPCPPLQLAAAIDAGLEQYRLVTAEAQLLNQTLSGSVRMMTQVLSLAMPEAFGLTQEARTLVRSVAEVLGEGPMWQIEMAAMLMRIGYVSLPREVISLYLNDQPLSREQTKMLSQTPALGHGLVASIPRLEGVAALILAQNDPPRGDTPIAARILRAVGDFQRFRQEGSPFAAIRRLQDSTTWDPNVVEVLADVISETCEIREVAACDLQAGMILESNVQDRSGRMLLTSGTEVHDAMIQKLTMLRRSGAGVAEPIQVRVMVVAKRDEAVACDG